MLFDYLVKRNILERFEAKVVQVTSPFFFKKQGVKFSLRGKGFSLYHPDD